MGLSDWSKKGLNAKSMLDILENGKTKYEMVDQEFVKNLTTINSGKAKGKIVGGNLSVFVGLIGSEYFYSDFHGKILILEDVNEPSYRIDRMMTQLELAGVFDQISGFIW